jgi:sulfite reductase alpha subunit-like flavoprotein
MPFLVAVTSKRMVWIYVLSFSLMRQMMRDWVQTYQRIPILCDELLQKAGARRLFTRGEGNAAGPEFFEAFDVFEADLWDTLGKVCQRQCTNVMGPYHLAGVQD